MSPRKFLFVAFTAIVFLTTGKAPGAVNLKSPERAYLLKTDSGFNGKAH